MFTDFIRILDPGAPTNAGSVSDQLLETTGSGSATLLIPAVKGILVEKTDQSSFLKEMRFLLDRRREREGGQGYIYTA